VQFVQGGTEWAMPNGSKVFVPATSFAACSTAPSTQPAPAPTTPSANPPSPKSPTTTTPPATTPQTTTPPSSSTPQQPSSSPQSPTTPRWPLPPPIQGPQETELKANPLNVPDETVGPIPPKPSDSKAVDESIQRLKQLREQQQKQDTTVAPAATVVPSDKAQGSGTAPPASACGPDVTDYVLGVLQMMQDTYRNSWSQAEREKRCGSLYGLGFNAAWDLQGFTPSDGESYMPEIFFQRAAPGYCAVPKFPCGGTVVFLGFCVNAQVANYVQWGLMNELCGSQVKGRTAISVRSVFSSNSKGQEIMFDIGEAFSGTLDLETKKRVLKGIMDTLVRRNQDDWYKMEGTDCPLICDQSRAKPWLDSFSWGYQWGSDGEPPETKRGYELQKP